MNFNTTEIKDYILIISGLGTFITAVIAAYTVVEIKRQRRSSYMPDIILDTYTAFWFWNKKFDDDSFFEFKRSKYNVWSGETKTENRQIVLLYKLQNIGLGVAKYLKCEWHFDYKRAIKEVQKVLPPDYSIEIDKRYIVIKKEKDEFIDFIYFSDLNIDQVGFILPESQYENPKDSTIPKIAVSLYLYYLIFKYDIINEKSETFSFEQFENFPKLTMSMKYKDIRNKYYSKKFEIGFEIADTSKHPESEENELGIFYINVNEK
jgi:hypothetical protein